MKAKKTTIGYIDQENIRDIDFSIDSIIAKLQKAKTAGHKNVFFMYVDDEDLTSMDDGDVVMVYDFDEEEHTKLQG